jgi:RNA polymerase sigma factor (sigma-70 family)
LPGAMGTMANGNLSPVTQFLRCFTLTEADSCLSDGELLQQFVDGRADRAFAALIRRHGPMVWAVCRRVLHNEHDAEDAFQATFLVLVRRAGSLGKAELVGAWLHGVAYRTALRVRDQSRSCQTLDHLPEGLLAADPLPELAWRELQLVLDEELDRLPDKYRAPFVLCFLEGKTYAQAARQLGWPTGTLSKRLTKSRELMRVRLARRGLGISAGLLGTVLTQHAGAGTVAGTLLHSTIKAASTLVAGCAATSAISVKVAALTQGVVKTMMLTKLKAFTCAFLLMTASLFCCYLALGDVQGKTGDGQRKGRLLRQAPRLLAGDKKPRPVPKKGRIFLYASLLVKKPGEDSEQRVSGIIAVDPETGKWKKITGSGHSQRVSPDGETLIFVRDDAIWNCDTKGSDNPGKISEHGGLPIWSPDGKRLLTSKGSFEKEGGKEKLVAQTWLMDADGSNAKELPIPKTDEVDDWSRDGKWLVTVSDRHPPHGHGYQLYVMRPDGTDQRRLTKDGLNCYPRFSPDGRKLVYCHQTAKEGNSIWVVDIDGKNARAIIKEEELVSPNCACWSPDGKRLAVVRFTWQLDEKGRRVGREPADADYHIEIMDAKGQHRHRLELADAKAMWLGHADWR